MSTINIRPAVGATAFILLISGLTPAVAAAGSTHSNGNGDTPPGNSAINQYIESMPTAGGGRPTGALHHNHGRGGGHSGSGAVSPSTQRALSRGGTAGQDALAFANATAPSSAAAQQGSGHSGGGQGAAGSATGGASSGSGGAGHRTAGGSGSAGTGASAPGGGTSGGSSGLSSVLSAFFGSSSSGGGLGPWLPVLLIVVLLGGCAVGLRQRYRRGSS